MEHFLFFNVSNLTTGLGDLLAVCSLREWRTCVFNEKCFCPYCNKWGAYL